MYFIYRIKLTTLLPRGIGLFYLLQKAQKISLYGKSLLQHLIPPGLQNVRYTCLNQLPKKLSFQV